jgi:hypothetical protein
MSRFGFVTPNDPPRAPGAPKPRKNQPARPPGPRKMPRKIPKAPRHIFQNWKTQSHIKQNPNKLGYKRETSERRSNRFDSESTPSSFTRNSPSAFINFSIAMGDAKIAAGGGALKFLGKLTYPEKCPSLHHSRINFRCWTLPRIFWCLVEIRIADYYLIHVYLT